MCRKCGLSLCLLHAFPMHSVTCGEDVEEPCVRDRCFASNCQDPYNVKKCEKCPMGPVGHYFSCPLHMQEHHEDCHSYKRSVLGVRYRPEAADLHKAIISLRARQATHINLSRAPVCRRTIKNQPAPSAKRPNAEVMAPLPVVSAMQGAVFPRAPVLRMGSRPLSVGGKCGGRAITRAPNARQIS